MNATTMKESFPIIFGDTEIPFPLTWEEVHSDIVTTNITEDGKDHVLYTRRNKLKVNASWKCTDYWLAFFRTYYIGGSFKMKIYDPMLTEYREHTVRIHEFTSSLLKGTWNLLATYGVWEVSFTIEEF